MGYVHDQKRGRLFTDSDHESVRTTVRKGRRRNTAKKGGRAFVRWRSGAEGTPAARAFGYKAGDFFLGAAATRRTVLKKWLAGAAGWRR